MNDTYTIHTFSGTREAWYQLIDWYDRIASMLTDIATFDFVFASGARFFATLAALPGLKTLSAVLFVIGGIGILSAQSIESILGKVDRSIREIGSSDIYTFNLKIVHSYINHLHDMVSDTIFPYVVGII